MMEVENHEEFKERLLAEFEQLTVRIAKAECYLVNNSDELLRQQIDVMYQYKAILSKRIFIIMCGGR